MFTFFPTSFLPRSFDMIDVDRPPGQQLLKLLADVPMTVERCHRVWHHNDLNVTNELKQCGGEGLGVPGWSWPEEENRCINL